MKLRVNLQMKEKGHEIRLITGVNLPMLIESLSQRTSNQTLSSFYQSVLTDQSLRQKAYQWDYHHEFDDPYHLSRS